MAVRRTGVSKNKGQALVETALVLPIIILILTGIIDFGLMFNNYLVITNASREGARSAAIGSSDAVVTADVKNVASNLNATRLKITVSPIESVRKKGDEITVTVEYDNNLLTPLVSAIVPNPVHLTAKTVMRME